MMPSYGSVAALIRVSPAGDIPNGDVSDGGFTLQDAWLRVENWDLLAESAPSGSTFVVPRTNQPNNGFGQVRATSHTVATLRALGSLRVEN